jgi:GAF domain-containing protein
VQNPSGDALSALSQFLIAEVSVGDTLRRVADITVEALPGAAFVGVTTLDERAQPTTAVCTDDQAMAIDQAQYDSGQGPCLDAWRTKSIIRIDDLADTHAAYAEFAASCLEHGIHSTLSLPLVAGETGVGAVNVYGAERGAFTPADERLATDLAATAAVVIANTVAYWGAHDLTQQLTQAMQSRAVIEQAKGMLMAKAPHLTADEAFDLLRRASQRENVKLRDIAQRIVDRRTYPES